MRMKQEKLQQGLTLALLGLVGLGLAVWAWLRPADALSISERRKLAQKPALSVQSVQSGQWMQKFESYSLDQFPLRDTLRGLKAAVQLGVFCQKDNNGVYLQNGYASKLDYPLHTDSVERAADKFLQLQETYLEGKAEHVYYALIPDKNYFMAPAGGYPALDYEKLAQIMRQKLSPGMTEIDLFSTLSLSCYYRTDPHWRQEALVPTAQYLAGQMGVSLGDDYSKTTLQRPYYGLYYGYAALPMQPDALTYLTSARMADYTVTNYESGRQSPVYDLDKAAGNDLYEVFLSGPVSLLTIQNSNARSNRELVIFRDSFGSSLAPLLAEGYSEITLVDIRYLPSARVGQFVDFTGKDVLFLYSTQVLNNSEALK